MQFSGGVVLVSDGASEAAHLWTWIISSSFWIMHFLALAVCLFVRRLFVFEVLVGSQVCCLFEESLSEVGMRHLATHTHTHTHDTLKRERADVRSCCIRQLQYNVPLWISLFSCTLSNSLRFNSYRRPWTVWPHLCVSVCVLVLSQYWNFNLDMHYIIIALKLNEAFLLLHL